MFVETVEARFAEDERFLFDNPEGGLQEETWEKYKPFPFGSPGAYFKKKSAPFTKAEMIAEYVRTLHFMHCS